MSPSEPHYHEREKNSPAKQHQSLSDLTPLSIDYLQAHVSRVFIHTHCLCLSPTSRFPLFRALLYMSIAHTYVIRRAKFLTYFIDASSSSSYSFILG